MSYHIPRVLVSLLLFSLLGYTLALPVRRADQSATALEIPDLLKGALGLPSSTTNRLRVPSNADDLVRICRV
ncbi:hypothetical protein BJ165DRAFT_1466375 [Panaeolus papilionaceus]|nr:hypothetical protein BJ165DRAFT_1466375 [Panaeolus papilionaceus]